MFSGLDLNCCADAAQPLTTAGKKPENLSADHHPPVDDMSDMSEVYHHPRANLEHIPRYAHRTAIVAAPDVSVIPSFLFERPPPKRERWCVLVIVGPFSLRAPTRLSTLVCTVDAASTLVSTGEAQLGHNSLTCLYHYKRRPRLERVHAKRIVTICQHTKYNY